MYSALTSPSSGTPKKLRFFARPSCPTLGNNGERSMIRVFIFLAVATAIALRPGQASAAHWHLVMVEKSELYSAVAAYRIESSLIQYLSSDQVAVWVRTDFLRPKGYKYPKQPRLGKGNFIQTDSYLWQKDRFLVDCRSQQIQISDGSYLLAGENIELDSHKPRVFTRVSPDSVYEVVYKVACANQQPRPPSDILRFAQTIEQLLLPDRKEQDRIRQEKNVPRIQI